jgi:uncharacterized iron-regulated membrane protein
MSSPGLLRIHRWVALVLGVVVLLLTLAGAALVWRNELTATFTPEIVIAPRPPTPHAWQRVLEAARARAPEARSVEIEPPERADRAWEVILHGARAGRHLFVDPHDGRVLADSARQAMPFVTLFRLHTSLFLGPAGEYLAALGGFALLFMAMSGIVLWWPRSWKHAFRLRLDGNRVAVSYDLHRALGAAFALFLLANAVTGLTLVFDDSAPRVVNAMVGAKVPALPGLAPGPLQPLDGVVAAADAALPGGRVSRVRVLEGAPVMVRKRMAQDNDTHGMNRIFVDGATGEVLAVRPIASQSAGSAMYEWIYPLHTGKLVGWPYRMVLLLAGLVPVVSLATGLILWRSRSKRKKDARAPAASRQLA